MSEIILAEIQTPSNPSTGFRSFHINGSNVFGMLDSTGLFTPFTTKSDQQIRDLIGAMIQNGGDTSVSLAYNSGLGQLIIQVVDNTLVIASSQVTGTNLANGLVKLDASALIPSSLLPAYVDDVLEFANLAAFPATGETGKIYIAIDTNRTYRWSGSVYVSTTDGGVNSFNTRTGVVTAAAGDYTATQVTNTPAGSITSNTVQAALNELDTLKQAKIATGYTIGTTPPTLVNTTDTLLAALGKLQYQNTLTQRKFLSAILTNSSNVTLTSMSTLAVNVEAGKTYSFDAKIVFQTAATTTGIVLTMTTVTAAGTLQAVASITIAADSVTAMLDGQITATNDVVIGTAVPAANSNFLAFISGTFICTTTGQLLPAFRSEVNASLVTVGLGSTIRCEEMVSV